MINRGHQNGPGSRLEASIVVWKRSQPSVLRPTGWFGLSRNLCWAAGMILPTLMGERRLGRRRIIWEIGT